MQEIKEITLESARELIGARVQNWNESGPRSEYSFVVKRVERDAEGDIKFVGGIGTRPAWVLTAESTKHYGSQWIRVLEPAPKSALEQLRAQRDEIDAKIAAEEGRIARDGLPVGWEWGGARGNDGFIARFTGDEADLNCYEVTFLSWNGTADDREVYMSGNDDATAMISLDVLLPWLRKVGALDSEA